MPVEYNPEHCECVTIADTKQRACDHPDHPDNKRKGSYDPFISKCIKQLCPKLRLDANHSSTMSTGHSIFLLDYDPNSEVCPIHNKIAIISEPFDEIGYRRLYCIDCVAHSLYDPRE